MRPIVFFFVLFSLFLSLFCCCIASAAERPSVADIPKPELIVKVQVKQSQPEMVCKDGRCSILRQDVSSEKPSVAVEPSQDSGPLRRMFQPFVGRFRRR